MLKYRLTPISLSVNHRRCFLNNFIHRETAEVQCIQPAILAIQEQTAIHDKKTSVTSRRVLKKFLFVCY